jgi:hypothetical protein
VFFESFNDKDLKYLSKQMEEYYYENNKIAKKAEKKYKKRLIKY